MFFRDRQEMLGCHRLPAVALQPQIGFVHRAGAAQQGNDRLVDQGKMIVQQRIFDPQHPDLDAFFLGAIHRSRVKNFGAIAPHAGGRLDAVAGFCQDLRHAGDFFTNLYTADAGGQ